MRIYIGNELYNFLKNVLITCFWDDKNFHQYKTKLDKLRSLSFKKEIIETTKECLTNNKIDFDSKFYLFGFENKVYDLNEAKFRDYKYDDYISIITGYEWIEPTKEQIITISKIINNIFPIENERELYLSILSTGLEGRCLEKFTIANGNGRNGKGLLHDLYLCALGNYGLIANSAILFETNKTGSNPEKNNIDKKRFIIFREPPEKSRFENSIIKELTGGGNFSARGHHESNTEKKLYGTIIVECNKKPLFSEEPTQADILRLIDIYFRSSFVEDDENIDEEKYIFKGNKIFKTNEFQNEHKFALLKILFEQYKKYKDNEYKFNIPDTIKQRTQLYLELSCNILTWFKDNYDKTETKIDIIKLEDLFSDFKESDYYYNLTKK
jgi:phage/plasmid-associated DNA primase